MTGRDATGTPTIEARHSSRPRATTVVAWTIWVLALLSLAIALVTPTSSGPTDVVGAITALLVILAAVLPAVTVGAILATRFPRNPVGWLLQVSGLAIALVVAASNLADYGLTIQPGSVPGAVWFAWLNEWDWLPVIACALVYLPPIFPTGHLLSPRWRVVVGAGTVGFAIATLESALAPFPPDDYQPAVQNPLSVGVGGPVGDLAALLGTASHFVVIGAVFLALASLVLRYRRGSGIVRQQLKWFAAVIAIGGPATVIALLTSNATDAVIADISNIAFLVALLSFALLPVAIGIAILRYRLYEIDRLISRTLVYGALAALLAGAYVGSVLALSALLAPLTSENSLAVAGSTLLVAALFQPVRRRVQSVVDRRFYRSRYDASQELADLSQRLRGEVDLDGVKAEVITTIGRTLQPASASIWLRSEKGPASR